MHYARWIVIGIVASTTPSAAQRPDPVIDMHLHANSARAQGPPPASICMSLQLPGIVQADSETVQQAFIRSMRNGSPLCADPILSPATDDELRERTLGILKTRNIVAVASGPLPFVQRWRQEAPDRIIPGLAFNVAQTRISPDSLRRLYQNGAIQVLGEVTNQYSGISPSDSLFEPYLAVAEEMGMPVGIHIGTGPPGAPYLGMTRYRARLHSPLLLEDALVRHPRLRVYIMHAGWPMLDDLLAVLWTHPQAFVDVGLIVNVLPEAEFYRYLRTIVEAGFGGRVMFGSDQMVWPETIERGIERIEKAPFLSPAQKRDILYNNAARFLRFTPEQIAQHYGR